MGTTPLVFDKISSSSMAPLITCVHKQTQKRKHLHKEWLNHFHQKSDKSKYPKVPTLVMASIDWEGVEFGNNFRQYHPATTKTKIKPHRKKNIK